MCMAGNKKAGDVWDDELQQKQPGAHTHMHKTILRDSE